MPIFKPENDEDLLKELESIENLCAKALTPATNVGFDMVNTVSNPGAVHNLLKNILRRSKNCQEYVKNRDSINLKVGNAY